MVINSKKEIYDGIIKKILIPNEYNEFNELKEEFDVSNIWFKVEVDNKEIDIIVPRIEKYGNLFVNDKVKLIKHITYYSEEEYKIKLKEQLNSYCSYLTFEERKEKYNEILKLNNYCIVNYDIILV